MEDVQREVVAERRESDFRVNARSPPPMAVEQDGVALTGVLGAVGTSRGVFIVCGAEPDQTRWRSMWCR